ncbi:hypothetical protein K457DRAFT_498420 [Linnemannia elongata AG-77]|uniref:Secreted protein n=1 Tax=Linnemannia elongata AG-77 TaxID=1314771 RepID=A0A197KE01_9FUNG|nr:hypothetical protein K457DRAFT_498420 [Linnemannia elongata AG-77]
MTDAFFSLFFFSVFFFTIAPPLLSTDPCSSLREKKGAMNKGKRYPSLSLSLRTVRVSFVPCVLPSHKNQSNAKKQILPPVSPSGKSASHTHTRPLNPISFPPSLHPLKEKETPSH